MSEHEVPRCPVCKGRELEDIEERETPFLGCTQCFGLFVHDDDLEGYVVRALDAAEAAQAFRDLLQRALSKSPRPGVRKCPGCGLGLARLGFGDAPFIVIDRCPQGHGIWLDKKELKKLVRACRAHAAVLGLLPAFQDDPEEPEEAEE